MNILPYSVNRREDWDQFILSSKNGTFLFQRSFMDYHADRFFDCSVMVYDGDSSSNTLNGDASNDAELLAVFPANWSESERCVYSHQGLTYGGLIFREDTTQVEVIRILRNVLRYYQSMLNAEKVVYKAIPYIYSTYPSGEDLYALFRCGAKLSHRLVGTVVSIRNQMKMRTLRIRQAKKAIDHGFYMDRMIEGDWKTLREYWTLLEEVLMEHHHAQPVHSFEEIRLLMERFPREIRLYLVRSSERIVAGVVAFETKQVAHMQYIASGKEGREFGALDLLFRHLINERYRQMEYVDLGTSNEDGGNVLNEGLVFQKEGFGGRAVCYDTYDILLHSSCLEDAAEKTNREETLRIPFLDLKALNRRFEPELTAAVDRVVHRGWYLLGEEGKAFAAHFAEYCGAKFCVPVGNGLEAITLILNACKILYGWEDGSEVIVPANTYIASILAVSNAGLKPVLCEPDSSTLLIDPARVEGCITERTVCILPVHLYGWACDMDALAVLAERHHLLIVDDAAQAHGAKYHGKRVGSLCLATAFSFYPTKNFGALGDAGAVCTDEEQLADLVAQLANYGTSAKYVNDHKGMNSRMDEIQAAVLDCKLPKLDADNQRRREIAAMYFQGIHNPLLKLPLNPKNPEESVYHIFPVRCPNRDALQEYLKEKGVDTMVHYPIPPHKQKAYKEWNDLNYPLTERIHREILSLPVSPILSDEEVQYIIQALNAFVVEL